METIGKYEVQRVVGRGGMGTVYEALDPHLNRKVALKIMMEGLTQSPSLRARFLREAQAAGGLRHKNIVTVYDLGDDEKQPYIAMEFVEGADLETLIQNREPLSMEWKLDVLRQICDGLAHAHRHGIVHRDIKPANVRITAQGEVKIMDFGIARLQSAQATKTGRVLGTVHYLAPEQIEREKVDHRADIFSVGAIAYELFSYRKPFEGESLTAVMFKIMHERPDPSALPQTIYSPGLEAIILKAMARDVQERYQSLDEMYRDLEDLVRRTAARLLEDTDRAARLLAEAREERRAGRLEQALRIAREAAQLSSAGAATRTLLAELEAEERQARGMRWKEEGRRRLAEGDHARALECANQALALAPGDPVARALAREAEGQALGTPSSDESAELRAAVKRAVVEGKLQKALGLCQRLLEKEPQDKELARAAAEIEAEIHSREVEQLCGMALSYAAEGDIDLAEKIAAKIERLAPESPRYLQLKEYLDQERRRRTADALLATAGDHLSLGNLEEARAAAEEALTAYPGHTRAMEMREGVARLLSLRDQPPAGEPSFPPEAARASLAAAEAMAAGRGEAGEPSLEPRSEDTAPLARTESPGAVRVEPARSIEPAETAAGSQASSELPSTPSEPAMAAAPAEAALAAGETPASPGAQAEGIQAETMSPAPSLDKAVVQEPEPAAEPHEGVSAQPEAGLETVLEGPAPTVAEGAETPLPSKVNVPSIAEAPSRPEAAVIPPFSEIPPPPLTPLPEGAPHHPEAARLLETARRHLRARDAGKALLPLEEAAGLEPEHPGIRRLLTLTRIEARKQELEALSTEALDHFVHSRYAEARRAVEQALSLDPNHKKARDLQNILGALG